MIKNVPVCELAIGDVVRMAHLSDEFFFMDMQVTKVTALGITCHRPYLLQESNLTVRLEELYFPHYSSILFNVLSLGTKQ